MPGTPYKESITHIAADPLAREVKRADLTHNMDLSRIKHAGEKDRKAYERLGRD